MPTSKFGKSKEVRWKQSVGDEERKPTD